MKSNEIKISQDTILADFENEFPEFPRLIKAVCKVEHKPLEEVSDSGKKIIVQTIEYYGDLYSHIKKLEKEAKEKLKENMKLRYLKGEI